MLARSIHIPRAWGFRYVSQLVWVKERIATGYWARNRHEIVMLYKRGAFPCMRPAPFPDSVIDGQQREHSRKPDALHKMIDAAWPDAKKLEMFSREDRPGWDHWGHETGKFGRGA
jgi:N6-adenosine-specific RNA methylase IME4